MRKNILISTTRQWNPGDEFIMHGVLNAINCAFGNCLNPIIFNRNPDVRGGGKWRSKTRNAEWTYRWEKKYFRGKGILTELFRLGHWDNSFKDDMDPNCIDVAIFAGSPEWFSRRLSSMYRAIDIANIPTVFLGLGAGDQTDFSSTMPIVKHVLEKARLITCRDRATTTLLESFGAKFLPCPALLSTKTNRHVTEVKRIGLIYATDHTVLGNHVSPQMHKYILGLYAYLASKYDVALVCHYVDEIELAQKDFPGMDVFYSYDSKDYAEIYNHFDLVIGGRVHGIGMCASLGIPGIMIKHDTRSDTTDGFLADYVQIGMSYESVDNIIQANIQNISNQSLKLIEHKANVMNQYVRLLRNVLNFE